MNILEIWYGFCRYGFSILLLQFAISLLREREYIVTLTYLYRCAPAGYRCRDVYLYSWRQAVWRGSRCIHRSTTRRGAICIINYGIIAIDRRNSLPLALARLHLLTYSIYRPSQVQVSWIMYILELWRLVDLRISRRGRNKQSFTLCLNSKSRVLKKRASN